MEIQIFLSVMGMEGCFGRLHNGLAKMSMSESPEPMNETLHGEILQM